MRANGSVCVALRAGFQPRQAPKANNNWLDDDDDGTVEKMLKLAISDLPVGRRKSRLEKVFLSLTRTLQIKQTNIPVACCMLRMRRVPADREIKSQLGQTARRSQVRGGKRIDFSTDASGGHKCHSDDLMATATTTTAKSPMSQQLPRPRCLLLALMSSR